MIEEKGEVKVTQSLVWSAVTQAPFAQTQAQGAGAAAGVPGSTGVLNLPWPRSGNSMGDGAFKATHEGAGKPWLTIQSLAAIPLKAPFAAGYRIN